MLPFLKVPKNLNGEICVAKDGGCDRCRNSGYLGRLAIYEVCLVTPSIEELIVRGASSAEIKSKAIEEGFIPMREYGWHKVMNGDTTVEEVLAATTVELRADS